MIQEYTIVTMADNAGARRGKCIRVLGGSGKRYASVGDLIVIALLEDGELFASDP